jgi:hypothetical protein
MICALTVTLTVSACATPAASMVEAAAASRAILSLLVFISHPLSRFFKDADQSNPLIHMSDPSRAT